jgi:carbon-monoxide dehydrogenase medium subunit
LKPSAFDYHAPETLEEATMMLADFGGSAKILAGGQSLIPMLSLRLAYFDHLIDIGRIPGLSGIRLEHDRVSIGATTVDAALEGDEVVDAAVPMLARATPLVGHFQIRNRGTVGGSIAHADPSAEYPAVALALDAELEAVSARGTRQIAAREFFLGFWTTALEPDEILVGVRFPVWSGRCGFAVREFARRHGDFAISGAVVAVEIDPDDRVERCAIGLFGMGSTPLRATVAEEEVVGQTVDVSPKEVGRLAMAGLSDVPSDMHGSAAYRTRVGAAMAARAWADAIREARGA